MADEQEPEVTPEAGPAVKRAAAARSQAGQSQSGAPVNRTAEQKTVG